MELLQLYYFERIAKYQSVTRASEELHVSQPSLSSCIIRLEKELGAPLFDRSGRNIVLNSYGRYFLNMTRQILNLVNECKVPKSEKTLMERISIGFMNYNEKMFSIMADFVRENPSISLNVYGSTMSAPFAYESYDFIVGRVNENIPFFKHNMEIQAISSYVIVPKGHPLAEKKELTYMELKNESFCFLKDNEGGYEDEYRACILSGYIPRCEFVTNDAFYKFRYIMQNPVFGFIPVTWKEVYERCDNIVLVPLSEKRIESMGKLCWSDATLALDVNQKFLRYVKDRLDQAPGSM